MNRLACAAVLAVAVSGLAGADDPKEAKARVEIKSFTLVVELYAKHPKAQDKYPEALKDLFEAPPWGGAPYVEGDKKALDPWGQPYHYEVVKDKDGNSKVYVWSERKVGDETKVIGTKPPKQM